MGRKTLYTHDNDDDIERMYVEENVSLRSLSKEFSIPVMTIKRRLIKRGVEIRNISSAMRLFHELKKDNRASASTDASENPNRVTGVVQFDDQKDEPKAEDDLWIS
jgi:hypothetical protein